MGHNDFPRTQLHFRMYNKLGQECKSNDVTGIEFLAKYGQIPKNY